ncbi:PREDICTED: uncharacterized protein LOC108375483 [Rhagoletis zephyria]|uniref:uncharacterized protein LOC108375483 n=1 Tax=Rhagoletis zephyria TaxID=28612 RepID=UPI00081147B3|nr:PREDICTED: uncharacterized protein LOC108375483 [Rhagoletis zephyria]XP_017487102.1 PREDICTED: uncharacterized protein LOC108375483 [Rhagoletis zephyria]XP_017487103.1 PREDICTED: uncharacterized protein LOC108375483 [Rhagoletis zephyria]
MPKPSGNPRCKCCDEVMEELLNMRQTFEKLFHRLNKEIVDLRREVTEGMGQMSSDKALKRESSCSPSAPSPLPTKFKQYNDSDSETECISLKKDKKASTSKKSVDANKEDPKDPVDIKNVANVSRPVLDFYSIQARVMPTQPFKTAQQFEDWNTIFTHDEDQCDQLRVELLQGHFDEPDKYIKHIWRSVFKNDAAENYSYRGNGRCKKRAIKNYIFTDIFRECFLQRFHHMDATFFMERTMRFFNYVHDQWRKKMRNQRGGNAKSKNEEPIDNDMATQDEQSFNGYEGSMFE